MRLALTSLTLASFLSACGGEPAPPPEPAGDAEEAALQRAQEMIDTPRSTDMSNTDPAEKDAP